MRRALTLRLAGDKQFQTEARVALYKYLSIDSPGPIGKDERNLWRSPDFFNARSLVMRSAYEVYLFEIEAILADVAAKIAKHCEHHTVFGARALGCTQIQYREWYNQFVLHNRGMLPMKKVLEITNRFVIWLYRLPYRLWIQRWLLKYSIAPIELGKILLLPQVIVYKWLEGHHSIDDDTHDCFVHFVERKLQELSFINS